MKKKIITTIKLNLQLMQITNNPEYKMMIAYSICDLLYIIDCDIDDISSYIQENIEYREYLEKAMEKAMED